MNIEILNEIQSLSTFQDMQKFIYSKTKCYLSKSQLLHYYLQQLYLNNCKENIHFESKIRIKSIRSNSGELEISTMLPPHQFSCKYDCAMCPNEPNQPRSYLSSEGTPKLGVIENFDIKFQLWRRFIQLEYLMGHHIDKIIHILLGGTFHSFPKSIVDEFIHNLYYACNLYSDFSYRKNGTFVPIILNWLKDLPFQNHLSLISIQDKFHLRERKSFKEEKEINANLLYGRITGIVIETRPDQISKYEIHRLRNYGVTRVQLGIQHNDENVLKIMNRRHDIECSKKAIQKLKDNGFKIDIHLLLDCPGTTLEKDFQMCKDILSDPYLLSDYLKLYICVDVPFTKFRKYRQNTNSFTYEEQDLIQKKMIQGHLSHLSSLFSKNLDDILIWIPFAESQYDLFIKMLLNIIPLIPSFIRLNRFHRDFPLAKDTPLRLGYESDTLQTNIRQICFDKLISLNINCNDIRSREIRNHSFDIQKCFLYIKSYEASDGIEYFISIEYKPTISIQNTKIIGMIRCRISNYDLKNNNKKPSWILPIFFKKTLKIRELHIYGNVQSSSLSGQSQHRGFGKLLMNIIENIAIFYKLEQIAIISGIGVQNYYKKLGYSLENDSEYMIKPISKCKSSFFYIIFYLFIHFNYIFSLFFYQHLSLNSIHEKLFIIPLNYHQKIMKYIKISFLIIISLIFIIYLIK